MSPFEMKKLTLLWKETTNPFLGVVFFAWARSYLRKMPGYPEQSDGKFVEKPLK
jgi:hypothetical protein